MPHIPPKKILEQICTVAKDKTEQSWERILVLGFFAGSYISLGCLMAIMVGGGIPSIQEENPGLQRLVFGAVFTFGLMLCVISGSELYTANTIYILPSLIERRIKPLKIVKHLAFAYIGNFIGAVVVAGFFTKLAGLVDNDPWNSFTNRFGENKVQIIWYQQLIRGIGCTWLVCLATWMSTASDEIIGKIFAIFFPITSFIAIGFDHLVANMYFIPLAMMNGANISGAEFVLNLVLLTVGNTFGGLILVGFLYWAAYGRQPVKKSSDLHYELLEDRK